MIVKLWVRSEHEGLKGGGSPGTWEAGGREPGPEGQGTVHGTATASGQTGNLESEVPPSGKGDGSPGLGQAEAKARQQRRL